MLLCTSTLLHSRKKHYTFYEAYVDNVYNLLIELYNQSYKLSYMLRMLYNTFYNDLEGQVS